MNEPISTGRPGPRVAQAGGAGAHAVRVRVEPVFFDDPAGLRAWLVDHARHSRELFVGFHKVGTGRGGPSWSQAVDQALCFGWVDGVRRRIDDDTYVIRFTPRRPESTWSKVNVAKVERLSEAGLMTPEGMAAFARRAPERTGIYTYEQTDAPAFTAEEETTFKGRAEAWAFFADQAPWYRRTAAGWVTQAKRPETRARRLVALMDDSAAGRRLRQYDRRG
ncbi:MAG: YdeI/OmpD-associated family protein [Actinomycetota bacterium]|nr:YdeI/OmpD-associated family protein [Actinomycetota bacterium]